MQKQCAVISGVLRGGGWVKCVFPSEIWSCQKSFMGIFVGKNSSLWKRAIHIIFQCKGYIGQRNAHSPLHRIVFIMLTYTKLPVDYEGGLCFSDFSDNIALVLSFHCSFSCGTGKQNKNTPNKRENAKCRVKIVNRNEKFNRRNWSIEINPYTVIQIHLN